MRQYIYKLLLYVIVAILVTALILWHNLKWLRRQLYIPPYVQTTFPCWVDRVMSYFRCGTPSDLFSAPISYLRMIEMSFDD